MQTDAGIRDYQAAAKAHVVALNERHHVSLGIGRTQVHRSTLRRSAGYRQACVSADQLAAVVGIRLRQQISDRDTHVRRIGDVRESVGKAQLDSLNLAVNRQHAVAFREGKAFQQIQRDQCNQPVPVRRNFPDIETTIIDADRVDPFHLEVCQIGGCEMTTGVLHAACDALGKETPVKRPSVVFRDCLQGVRMPGGAPDFPCPGCVIGRKRVEPSLKMRLIKLRSE